VSPSLIALVLCGCAAYVVSMWATRQLCHPRSRLHILDHPNERSLHSRPTPRTGGVAIFSAILLVGSVWLLYAGDQWQRAAWLAAAVSAVAVTSFIDDRRHIEPQYRLLAHVAAGVALLYGGFRINDTWSPFAVSGIPEAAIAILSVLYVVWMLELYNFMDGIDGFAGGMAVVGFGTLAVLSSSGGVHVVTGLCVIVAAASLGFLMLNFPPAKIFMGDVGSATLGLLLGALSIWGAQRGTFPLWAAVLVFSPFIVDATITIVARALRREKVWRPHRSHYYQRLVQLGWSHRRVVLWEYALMAAASISAVWGVRQPQSAQVALLATWALIYGALATAVHILENNQPKHVTILRTPRHE
jgi:UDP-N-acetylmuramyl pentapeptide phosphotransferase/UDP-N-acetylglucosamine-1-phosphate transferase